MSRTSIHRRQFTLALLAVGSAPRVFAQLATKPPRMGARAGYNRVIE